jgi:hypothetical protein
MSRCSDLAIFVLIDGQTDRTDYLPVGGCVGGAFCVGNFGEH